jgi:hypothetical protein
MQDSRRVLKECKVSLSTFSSLVLILAACGLASAGPKIQNEVPAGTMNGTNAVFQFAAVPIPSSVQLYKNGIRLAPTLDFTLSAKTLVLKTAHVPSAGDSLLTDYEALVPLTPMQMVNKLTNDCLANQSTNGGGIIHTSCLGVASQKVLLTPVTGGYMATFQNSGQQLDVVFGQNPGGTADGIAICQYPFWGGDNEVWMPVPTGDPDGTFYLQVKSTAFRSCLTINSSSTVVQQTCAALDGQKWQFR